MFNSCLKFKFLKPLSNNLSPVHNLALRNKVKAIKSMSSSSICKVNFSASSQISSFIMASSINLIFEKISCLEIFNSWSLSFDIFF